MLGARPVRSHLVYELVRLERELGAGSGWEDRYAEALVSVFSDAPPA